MAPATEATVNEYDVIVVGAGISGVNAGYRLQTEVPGCNYTILEARDGLGGEQNRVLSNGEDYKMHWTELMLQVRDLGLLPLSWHSERLGFAHIRFHMAALAKGANNR